MKSSIHSAATRREFLAASAMTGAGFAIGNSAKGAPAEAAGGKGEPRRSLRLAMLSDIHLQPERGAEAGLVQGLRHVQSQDDRPSLIINGGDAIMDSLAADDRRTGEQWALWKKVLSGECSLPVMHCLGNHDVWGWDKRASGTTGTEQGWGKERAIDELGLAKRYYRFDRSGWRFFVLDSIFPDAANVYIARLDDEQFAWLAGELERTPRDMHVAIVSHISVLSVAHVEFREQLDREPRRRLGVTHSDAQRLVRLFRKHPQIKLALSGHLHLTERIEYGGITYLCAGSVSGAWWRGDHYGTDEGYLVVDLFEDGRVREQYVPYGWKVRA